MNTICGDHHGMKRRIFDEEGQEAIPGMICPFAHQNAKKNFRQVTELNYLLGKIVEFFDETFGYTLFADEQEPFDVTINWGKNQMQAYWTGNQVVLGSGVPSYLHNFHNAGDVIVHEITHTIVQRTSGLKNAGETGALFEHVADVIGILYQQQAHGGISRRVENLEWTIGGNLWGERRFSLPGGRKHPSEPMDASHFNELPYCLRSLADPESTNPRQPIHYDNFQNLSYDAGGVHLNCGIPSYAFYTAAVAAGSEPWKGVGQIWFRATVNTNLGEECKFARFAAFTTAYAKRDYPELSEPLRKGWTAVGIVPDTIEGVDSLL